METVLSFDCSHPVSNWPAKLNPKPFCPLHGCGHSSIQDGLEIKLKQGNIEGSILRQHKEAEI